MTIYCLNGVYGDEKLSLNIEILFEWVKNKHSNGYLERLSNIKFVGKVMPFRENITIHANIYFILIFKQDDIPFEHRLTFEQRLFYVPMLI